MPQSFDDFCGNTKIWVSFTPVIELINLLLLNHC